MVTPIDGFTPTVMLTALSQGNRPTSFLQDRLIGSRITHETDEIKIDVEKNGDTIAAYVSRQGGPNEIGKREFTNVAHAIPYTYENVTFTPKDLKERTAGVTIYEAGKQNKITRLQKKMGEGLDDLMGRLDRLEEKQVAEAIQTGKVVVQGKDVDYTVDFQMDQDHLIDVGAGDVWSNNAVSILTQLKTAATLIKDSGAPIATELYLGDTAAVNFLRNAEIKELLDLKNFNIGEVVIEQLSDQCASYLGVIAWPGVQLRVYNYSAKYKDAAGATQSYIDPVNAVLGSGNARFNMHFGMIESMEDTEGVERWPNTVMDPKGKGAELSMESGPLAGLHQPDAFARIKTEL